jgi:hypothetical protein
MFRQALAIAEGTWGADHADTARIETNLGELLAKRGRVQESERLLREGLRSREKILPPNHPDIFDGKVKLGAVLVREGRFQEAEPLLLSAYRRLENSSGSPLPKRRLALEKVVEMYTAWSRSAPHGGKAEQAAKWKALESEIR